MKISMLRPLLLKALNRLFSALGGKGSIVELGERVRFGRACEVKLERHAFARFGDDVKLRSGCILQVAKDARLELASQVELRHYALIECGHSVSVGKRSVIGAYNWLQGSGTITIGNDVIMGPGVRIISTTHDSSNAQCTFAELPLIPGEVVVGDNVWIGANVIILSGVTIGKNVVIGAGALVNRDLPENGIYVGVPAHCIKDVASDL